MAVSLCCKCLTVALLFLLHIQMCTSDKLPEPYVANQTAKAVTLNCTPPPQEVQRDRWDAVYSLQITAHLHKVFGYNETVAKVINNKPPERGGQFFQAAVGKVDGWLGIYTTLRDSDPLPYLQVTFLVTSKLQGDYFCNIQYSSLDTPESSPVFSSKVTVGEDGEMTPSMGKFKSAIVQGVQVTATWHHPVTPFIEAGVFATPVDGQGQQIGTRHTLFLAHEAPSEGQDVGAGDRVYTHPQVLVLSFKIDPTHDTNGQNLTVILFLKKQIPGQRFSTAAMYENCFGSDEQFCVSDPRQNAPDAGTSTWSSPRPPYPSTPLAVPSDSGPKDSKYMVAFYTLLAIVVVGFFITVIVKRKAEKRKQRNRKIGSDSVHTECQLLMEPTPGPSSPITDQSIQIPHQSSQTTDQSSPTPGPSIQTPHQISQTPHQISQTPHQISHTADQGSHTADQGSHSADQGSHTADQGSHTADQGSHSADQGSHTADQSSQTADQSSHTAGPNNPTTGPSSPTPGRSSPTPGPSSPTADQSNLSQQTEVQNSRPCYGRVLSGATPASDDEDGDKQGDDNRVGAPIDELAHLTEPTPGYSVTECDQNAGAGSS